MTPAQLDSIVRPIVALYEDAQLRILGDMSRRIGEGRSVGLWQLDKLAQLQAVLRLANTELSKIPPAELERAFLRAYRTGTTRAISEIRRSPDHQGRISDSVSRGLPLARELAGYVQSVHPVILRSTEDIYRSVIARGVSAQLLGVQTYQQAGLAALDEFAQRGITAFYDRRGRQWSMDTYVDMSLRTGSHRAQRQGHLDKLVETGTELVQVSGHSASCPDCGRWEGKTLVVRGLAPEGVHVDGTIDEARADGLEHPGCRHRFVAYFPGITRPVDLEQYQTGETYEQRQYRRRAERHAKEWRRRAAAAPPRSEARKRARAKAAQWSAAARAA